MPANAIASAALFPGQGSQTPRLRETVERYAPELLERAAAVVGEDPFERVEDGTRYAQPAIFCGSIAGWVAVRERSARWLFAGHSLGELSALTAAGVLTLDDGLRLVALRGRLMQESEAATSGAGMMALVGRDVPEARELVDRSGALLVNDNSPEQVVVSGSDVALGALEQLVEGKSLKALRLPIAGGFHTPQLAPQVAAFQQALLETQLGEPAGPVYSSATGAPFTDVRRELASAMARPVLWHQTVTRLLADGASEFADVGPGKVLSRLMSRTYGSEYELISVDAEMEQAHV